MSTRQVLGAVGAAVGFYFGGAQGAQWGWAIGSTIGGVVDPEIIRGPSIGDIANQTSQEGIPRPIVFALSQPIAGNIIGSGEPRIVRARQRQGKGGPKVETESVYRTYAIGVCEGPITRFVRVWRNGTLEYDVSDNPLVSPEDNADFLRHARFFLGAWDQDASPDLEVLFGAGTTPAHRGTAYMVMADEDLTDLRGAVPQYIFQVERCEGFFLTSRPYPIEAIDDMRVSGGVRPGASPVLFEALDIGGAIVGGSMGQILKQYTDGEPEAIDIDGDLIDGEMKVILVAYTDGEPEAIDIDGDLIDGEMKVILISYDAYEPEALNISGGIVSGTLG